MTKTALKPRALSCGCCTGGCVCWTHHYIARGVKPHVCEYHTEHARPGENGGFDTAEQAGMIARKIMEAAS